MPATRSEIYGQIAAFSRPVVLPGLWSPVSADPAWCLLDTAAFLPTIRKRFSDDELLNACVFVEGNDGPVLNPAFNTGPQITFVSRLAPDLEPSAILPGATSLDEQAAWRQILTHHRNVGLADENRNLLVSHDPLDLMIASSCGLRAAPLPPVAKINSRFLSDLNVLLVRPGDGPFLHHPSMVVLGWGLAEMSVGTPCGFDVIAEHCTKITAILNPEVPLKFWKTHPRTLDELDFILRFGDADELTIYLQDRIENEIAALQPPSVHTPEPKSHPVLKYWEAAAKGMTARELADLRTSYLDALGAAHFMAEEPSTDPRSAYCLDKQVALAMTIEVIESVADRLNPRQRGPHEPRMPNITDVVATVQRLLQARGAGGRRQAPIPQIERLRGILK